MMIESAGSGSSGGGSGGHLTGLQLHRQEEEETGDEVRELLQDPAAAATTEGSEATARATNHDGPARGDP